jgi:hypothetical protein
MGFGTRRALAAGLLVVLSLPTFWYAPYLLVDPGAVCMRMLFVFAVLTGQVRLALAAGLAATAIREENILLLGWLLGWLLVTRRAGVVPCLAALAALAVAAGWLVAVRWWIVPGLPRYVWVPSLDSVRILLADTRAMLSLAGCSIVVLPLALVGMWHAPARLAPLKSLLVLMVLPPLWAALSVRVEGRIVWGLYPFLIPFAIAPGLPRRSETVSDVRPLRTSRRA